ncbi:MAG: PEP-CTERM sorting domain-containing protein [Planctomycetota bacterium]
MNRWISFATLVLFAGIARADVTLGVLEFEDAADIASSTEPLFNVGNDYFDRTTEAAIPASFTNPSGSFFAAQDIDGIAASPVQSITLRSLGIAGFDDLVFSGLFAEDFASDSAFDWDDDDYFRLTYQIDGGAITNLLWFEGSGGANTQALRDTDFDGVGDGAALNDTFTLFEAPITGTGSEIVFTAEMRLNAGDEDIAFDTFMVRSVTAVPEPGSVALLSALVGAVAIGRRRRRRQV